MGEVSIINNFEESFGKFIQVCANDELYLWFGSGIFLHGEIFNDLLGALKIPYETFEEGEDKIKIPKGKGKNYELIGAGLFKKRDGKYILYNISGSYWIKPDKNHADEISKLTGLEFIIQ
jgi:hypothetical protein